ncbi:hypothetical protein BDN72DRAFT_954252 [Pluteus cervinus]|uniref:Uncharacterized protein n=1 Tax=Pluteus cervinus TaxID=181527 RepID=A0ACD3BEJ4_9AGAR|nr:hypothetical protein BDN72DRAFT_954252 [Pluteus cervinus]
MSIVDIGGGSQMPLDPGEPEPAGFHRFELLAPELQLRIIGHLVDKTDIFNVILANKYLYRLCLDLLYRDLHWTNPVVCAGIIRQLEIQRRDAASTLAQGGASMMAPDSLPSFPSTIVPTSLVLSLTYNTQKPKRKETYLPPHEFLADVDCLIKAANRAAKDYTKDRFEGDDVTSGASHLRGAFVHSLKSGRTPLYVPHKDFRLDLPAATAMIQATDPLDQLPHWDVLSHVYGKGKPNKRFIFYTSIPLYNQILATICNFSHLLSLIFYNSNLPPRLYDAIVSLPDLRSLVIDTCYLPPFLLEGVEDDDSDLKFNSSHVRFDPNPPPEAPPIMPTIRDFKSLPITSLTLLNLRSSSIDSYPPRHRAFSRYLTRRHLDRVQVLKLASAQNLKELVIDWDITSARYFGGVSQDKTDTTSRNSGDPLIAAFGRSAAAAFPRAYHTVPTHPFQAQPSTLENTTDLTIITTVDPSKEPYIPPRGLTSLTLNMKFKWPKPRNHPTHHAQLVPWLCVLDCSALLSSFLKKFEDVVDDVDEGNVGLEHLQIFSNAADVETVLAWQDLRDKEAQRRHLEDQGLPSDVGIPLALQQLDSCEGMTSLFFPLHPTILLPRLKTLLGPLHTIPSVLRRNIADERDGFGNVTPTLERIVVWDEMWYINSYPPDWISMRRELPVTSRSSEVVNPESLAILHKSLSVQNFFDNLGLGSPGDALGQCSPVDLPLKVLKVPLTEWSEEILYAVSDNLKGLRVLEVFYTKGKISEETLLSMGARFLCKLPHLQTLRLWNPAATWKPKPKRRIGNLHLSPELAQIFKGDGQEPEIPHDDHKDGKDENMVLQCLAAWKRHIPSLRELQLYPGTVWRRHSNDGKWIRREVVREGLDLDLDEFGDDAEVGGWKNGLHWRYWDRNDSVKELWRRGLGLESLH